MATRSQIPQLDDRPSVKEDECTTALNSPSAHDASMPRARGSLRRRAGALALPIATTLILCAAWEALARAVLPPQIPALSTILMWMVDNSASPALWTAIGQTLGHWAAGLAIAVVAGTVAGVAIGSSRLISDLFTGLFEFIRPIPGVVYLPLMLLIMGATSTVAVWLAALSAFWPVLFQVAYGVKNMDPLARDTADVFGLRPWQRIRYVVIPSLLPFLATGLRIASTVALLTAIVMELLGGIAGLGTQLAMFSVNGVYDAMYAVLLITGILGVVLNFGFARLEKSMLAWHPSHRPVSR